MDADLGNASDSDVDPLGGVHRGAGHGQGHRVQGHPATTNQIFSDTFILYSALLFFRYDLQYLQHIGVKVFPVTALPSLLLMHDELMNVVLRLRTIFTLNCRFRMLLQFYSDVL